MSPKFHILVVEDEAAIRTGLVDVLIYHGFEVDFAEEGHGGLQKGLSGKYDLILLDVMLPGVDGFTICEQIREQDKEQPIIMLTAKSADEDIISGLTLGADDYVAKPFSVTQLILRIQAVLRRSSKAKTADSQIVFSENRRIDAQNLSADWAGEHLVFTRREIDVLLYLHRHCERPVSREELLNKVWGYGKNLDLETRTVDIHIAKLRRKIETNPKEPEFLVTIRGAGYRLLSQ